MQILSNYMCGKINCFFEILMVSAVLTFNFFVFFNMFCFSPAPSPP